jgi:hypothetical protein
MICTTYVSAIAMASEACCPASTRGAQASSHRHGRAGMGHGDGCHRNSLHAGYQGSATPVRLALCGSIPGQSRLQQSGTGTAVALSPIYVPAPSAGPSHPRVPPTDWSPHTGLPAPQPFHCWTGTFSNKHWALLRGTSCTCASPCAHQQANHSPPGYAARMHTCMNHISAAPQATGMH